MSGDKVVCKKASGSLSGAKASAVLQEGGGLQKSPMFFCRSLRVLARCPMFFCERHVAMRRCRLQKNKDHLTRRNS